MPGLHLSVLALDVELVDSLGLGEGEGEGGEGKEEAKKG